MVDYKEKGRQAGILLKASRGINKIRFIPNTENYEALVDMPCSLFDEVPEPSDTDYYQGKVFAFG